MKAEVGKPGSQENPGRRKGGRDETLDEDRSTRFDCRGRVQQLCLGAGPHKRFYEKVIKVKADVAALLMFDLRHISTEKFALGSLRSDDWQLGRPIASLDSLATHSTIERGTKRNAV